MRRFPGKRAHWKPIVVFGIIAFKLPGKIIKGVKTVCRIKSLIILAMTALHFPVMAWGVRTNHQSGYAARISHLLVGFRDILGIRRFPAGKTLSAQEMVKASVRTGIAAQTKFDLKDDKPSMGIASTKRRNEFEMYKIEKRNHANSHKRCQHDSFLTFLAVGSHVPKIY